MVPDHRVQVLLVVSTCSLVCSQRPNSWDVGTKSYEFSYFLFTVNSNNGLLLLSLLGQRWFELVYDVNTVDETSSLRTLTIMPRNLNNLYVHEIGFSANCLCFMGSTVYVLGAAVILLCLLVRFLYMYYT
jgi:hypothetical protein